jgi:K(+)-stimulated pyrophosphate-energized sodium pump
MNRETLVYLIPVFGLAGLLYTLLKSRWVARQDPGNARMVKIAAAIQQGAMAFLRAEYRVLGVFVVAVAVLLGISGGSRRIPTRSSRRPSSPARSARLSRVISG